MNIGNVQFNDTDPFAVDDFSDEEKNNDQINEDINNDLDPFRSGGTEAVKVHIRIQQRNGRKSITTIQGLQNDKGDPYKLSDIKDKVLTKMKKKFCCNGKAAEDEEYGVIIQLQGDQRLNLRDYLLEKFNHYKAEDIVIHGF